MRGSGTVGMGRVDAEDGERMEGWKNLASSAGSVWEYLNGIHFPVDKEDLADKLRRKGAPDQIVEKVRGADLSRFESAQDVLAKIQG